MPLVLVGVCTGLLAGVGARTLPVTEALVHKSAKVLKYLGFAEYAFWLSH